jgi:hypothetical protein
MNCKICGADNNGFGYSEQNIKKHIVKCAYAEVWHKAIGAIKKTPHFNYYMKNTKPKRVELPK